MSPEQLAALEALEDLLQATVSVMACVRTFPHGELPTDRRYMSDRYAEAAKVLARLEAMQEEEEGA